MEYNQYEMIIENFSININMIMKQCMGENGLNDSLKTIN